jgi:hypothetical protein
MEGLTAAVGETILSRRLGRVCHLLLANRLRRMTSCLASSHAIYTRQVSLHAAPALSLGSFPLLVLVIAFGWGRRTVANLDRYLDGPHHRSRVNNLFI